MASLPSSDDPHVLITRPPGYPTRPESIMALHLEEYQRLKDEVERLQEERAELVATAAYGAKEMTRLRGLLKRLEWAGDRGSCSTCYGSSLTKQHQPGCEIAAELYSSGRD